MRYDLEVKEINKKHICPFCEGHKQEILESNKYFYVTLARAPYAKDHILIVPYRHVILFQELKNIEVKDLFVLIEKRTKKLHKHHKDVVLVLNDGFAGGITGKTINHLHMHLIPDCNISARETAKIDREFMDDKTFKRIFNNTRKKYA